MNSCTFTKHFTEPKEKYICLSSCLFFKESYIKVSKNLKTYNASESKVKSFVANLKKTIDNLTNGTYPSNYYLRLYYDQSIFKRNEYKELMEILKKHKKIQLVEYKCDTYLTNQNVHMDLFGTIVRFYTIFDQESPNMEYCIITDMDNFLEKKFFEIFDDCRKKDYLVTCFGKISQIGFHSNDFNTKFDMFEFSYLIACLIVIKKDPIFSIDIWDQYFNHLFEQYDLMYVFNYLDFKRYAINSTLKKDQLKPQSYYSFNYGADEIWINYVIKKILRDHQKKDKLHYYIANDYNLNIVVKRLSDLLEYNKIVNKEEFSLFIKNASFLSKKNNTSLKSHLNKLVEDKKNHTKIIEFFKQIRSNPFFNRLYIQNNLKYIILYIEELMKNRGKYNFHQILSGINLD